MKIYQLLDQLEPVEQESATYRPRQALGYIPLLLALATSFLLALRQLWRGIQWRDSGVRSKAGELR